MGYRRPTWAPFAALVPNPWFTVYICAQMYKEGHNAIKLLSGNRSLIVREPKKLRKEMETSLRGAVKHCTPQRSYQQTWHHYLRACYVFLSVGSYKASQNPAGKTILMQVNPNHGIPRKSVKNLNIDRNHCSDVRCCLKSQIAYSRYN